LEINITESTQGYTLKKPIVLEVPEPKDTKEEKVYEYILETFTGKSPDLAKFTFENKSAFHIAEHLLLHRTGSKATLYNYIYDIHDFTESLGTTPDQILNGCLDSNGSVKPIALARTIKSLESFAGSLKAERKLAPTTIFNMVDYIQLFFRLNGLPLKLPYPLRKWSLYEDRAPTQEELQKMLSLADLREKVIVCALATGGFRVGTLAKLQYRHVKRDIEHNIIPIHVHVEGEITKTKYHGYDTFLNFETSEYLITYLTARRNIAYKQRSETYPPENITDQSPLISYGDRKTLLTANQISYVVHNLLLKAGIISSYSGFLNLSSLHRRRYDVRPHSIRKFFRSQLALLGVDRDIIEYMMGHKTDKYHDVKMKGIEFLRSTYAKSGLTIRPQTKADKILALRAIARSWGLTPEEICEAKLPHSTEFSSFRLSLAGD
jgi:integrase